ncbi:lymphotoxin-alpha-like isoform X1 [Stigmatopora argus]
MMEEGLSRRISPSRSSRLGSLACRQLTHLTLFLLCAAQLGLVFILLRERFIQSSALNSKCVGNESVTSSALRLSQNDERKSALLTAPAGKKSNGKYLLWESKVGTAYCHGGFHYSNGNLVLPSKGIYRVFLQITYESNADLNDNDGVVNLDNKVFLFHDSYPKDRPLLSSVDTISCKANHWTKSLHTSGTFELEANSTLRVTSENVNLISSKEYLVFFGVEFLQYFG